MGKAGRRLRHYRAWKNLRRLTKGRSRHLNPTSRKVDDSGAEATLAAPRSGTLHDISAPVQELSGVEELETILPVEERRAIWRELQAAGFEMLELRVSPSVFWIAVAMVLTPLRLLVLALRTWFAALSIIELTFLVYKSTRP